MRHLHSFIIAALGLFASVSSTGCDEGGSTMQHDNIVVDDAQTKLVANDLSSCSVQCGEGEEVVYEGLTPTCACAPKALAGEEEDIVGELGEFSSIDELSDAANSAAGPWGQCSAYCKKGHCSISGGCPACKCGVEGVPHCKINC